MVHHRSGYIRIDINDFLDEIEDDDLIEELQARGLHVEADGVVDATVMELVSEAHAELRRNHPATALSILDRLILPKWKDKEDAADALDIFRSASAPMT